MADNEPAPPASEGDAGRPASGEPAPKNVAEASRFHPSYVFLAVVTVVNLVADLWSKQWAKSYFESARPGLERRLVIVDNYVNFIFAKNRGGAWGLLQNEAEGLRRPFFLVVSVAAIVFIVTGSNKARALRAVLEDDTERAPAARIRPVHGALVWMVDAAAAAELRGTAATRRLR